MELTAKRYRAMLRGELVDQCWLAELAGEQLRTALPRPLPVSPPPSVANPAMTDNRRPMSSAEAQAAILYKMERWAPVQTILMVAAFVSSLLCLSTWDNTIRADVNDEHDRQERLALVQLVVDDLILPPLSEIRERTVRNQLIHAEQKITAWALAIGIADPDVKLGSWAWGHGKAPPTIYRFLSEDAWELTVNGKSCRLDLMLNELRSLVTTVPVGAEMFINTSYRPK